MLLNNVFCFIGIAGRVTVPNQYDWFSKEGRSAWETAIDREVLSRLLQVCNKKNKGKKNIFINCSDKDVGKTKQTINKESKALLTVKIKLLVFFL